MLLQTPDPTAAASAATNSDTRPEEDETKGAAVDAADGRELTAVSASDLSPLQPFELEDPVEDSCHGEEVSQVAERLKDRGNALFKLGDTDAAAEMFTRVLRTLEPTPVAGGCCFYFHGLSRKVPVARSTISRRCCSAPILHSVAPPEKQRTLTQPRKSHPLSSRLQGATVLVRLASSAAGSATRYRPGMISDANDDGDGGGSPTYDVIYDEAEHSTDQQGAEQEEEEDEEDGVAADRVLGVPASPCVWCAARLNLARCSFRRGRHAEVRAGRTRGGGGVQGCASGFGGCRCPCLVVFGSVVLVCCRASLP